VCARHGTCTYPLGKYTDYPEGASPLWASWRSPLVSCKGVPGDRKSEGSSPPKAGVRTNRNCIRGTIDWVSNHIFVKPEANELFRVDAAGIDFRDKCLTRGDLDQTKVSRDVSRSHSTMSVGFHGKG